MKQPLISILFAAHNTEHSIGRCLEHLINQSYKNIEIIVVDDCSTDNTKKIIKSYSDKYFFVKYIFNNQQIGELRSLIKGLNTANGEYFYWTASDMYLEKNALKETINYYNDNNIDIISGSIYCYNNDFWSMLRHLSMFGGKQRKRIIFLERFPFSNVLIPRYIIKKTQNMFDENKEYIRSFDVAYSTVVSDMGFKIVYLPELKVFHDHPANYKNYLGYIRKEANAYVNIRIANPKIHYNFIKKKFIFYILLPFFPFGSTIKKIINGNQTNIMLRLPLFLLPLFLGQIYFWILVFRHLTKKE